MHIAFISTHPAWGGSEELWVATALKALTEGHQIQIFISERNELHSKLEELRVAGADIVFWKMHHSPSSPPMRIWRKITGKLRTKSAWWMQMVHESVDVICVNQGGCFCFVNVPGLASYLQQVSKPFVLVAHANPLHSQPDNSNREVLKKVFTKAASLDFVAKENIHRAERFLGIKLSDARVIQNPVNLINIEPVFWPKDSSKLMMACVARLETRDKGQDLLIEAIADPVWKNRDFHINFFGAGPDYDRLQELIECNGLTEKFFLNGYEPDIRKIWTEHQILLLPSHSEGTPLSLIEAQLCARPSLITRVDGNPDWIDDGVSGFIAEAPTVYHLRIALERVWVSRNHLQIMGKVARENCLVKRDFDAVNSMLKSLTNMA